MALGKLVGADDVTSDAAAGANAIVIDRFQCDASGSCGEIRLKVSTNLNAKVAIYADNAGSPGNRLAKQDTGQACVPGWNKIPLEAAVSLTSGAYVWLAYILDTNSYSAVAATGSGHKYKAQTYAGYAWEATLSGLSTADAYYSLIAGWVFVLSPSGLSQPIAYGTPKLSLSIKPPGHQQVIAYGTSIISTAGIVIVPQGIAVVISYGTPSLIYPQTISPPGLSVPISYGTPTILVAGEGVIFVPGHQQVIAYGTPTILKYVWHVILDGRYNIESPETNRSFVIGRDINGNPVWGEAQDSTELGLVGERLDFQPDPAIPTQAQASDVAAAILSKLRLGKKRGVILIPYNCGQELWDVVQITDAGANQSAVKFRVVGIRFEYHPKQARFEHRLYLGNP